VVIGRPPENTAITDTLERIRAQIAQLHRDILAGAMPGSIQYKVVDDTGSLAADLRDTSNTGQHEKTHPLLQAALEGDKDLEQIRDNLNLEGMVDALQIAVRLAALISIEIKKGARVVFQHKTGPSTELVVGETKQDQPNA
jgi:hypothetical protein